MHQTRPKTLQPSQVAKNQSDKEVVQMLKDQQRQIAELQRALDASKASNPSAGRSELSPARSAINLGWMKRENWTKLREGMSSEQIIDILGQPTRRKPLGTIEKLFWEGEVPGSGRITGNVFLQDNQLQSKYSVSPPAFL